VAARKISRGRKNPQEKTGEDTHDFTVLYMEGSDFRREKIEGTFIHVRKHEVEIESSFLLQPKQVLYWDDKQDRGTLRVAMVKWVKETGDTYRAGLSLL
jgi:hypothetical protein